MTQSPSFIIQGADGNFYGTIIDGSSGNIFRMTPDGNVTFFSLLFGLNPELAPTDDGNFYGTTTNGAAGKGSIFKVTLAGQITTVFSFNGTNGERPAGLRKGADGCFYGITSGTNGFRFPVSDFATIFQFTTNNTLTTLRSVTNASDFTDLPVQGTDGYLYGTTATSVFGPPPAGSTYRVSFYRLSTNGDYQTIYTRSNAPGPAGDLIFGPDGFLYGEFGSRVTGFPPSYGNIFRISTDGIFSNLFTFTSSTGGDPEARLLLASDGYFYGTTSGTANHGTLFRVTTNGDLITLIHFGGSNPLSPLIEATDGNIYGTTSAGSPVINPGSGTIFRLVQPTAISDFALSNTTATLTWNSFPGGIYRVEYKSALLDAAWTPLIQRVTATDLTITVFDNLATDAQRLYRVALLP
jgi:uncharacterized repeat protein (TIGR03803 family)